MSWLAGLTYHTGTDIGVSVLAQSLVSVDRPAATLQSDAFSSDDDVGRNVEVGDLKSHLVTTSWYPGACPDEGGGGGGGVESCSLYVQLLILPSQTTSLASWLRRPPRERQILGSIPALSEGIFPGGDISVT